MLRRPDNREISCNLQHVPNVAPPPPTSSAFKCSRRIELIDSDRSPEICRPVSVGLQKS